MLRIEDLTPLFPLLCRNDSLRYLFGTVIGMELVPHAGQLIGLVTGDNSGLSKLTQRSNGAE